jgi:hypothetical protein
VDISTQAVSPVLISVFTIQSSESIAPHPFTGWICESERRPPASCKAADERERCPQDPTGT